MNLVEHTNREHSLDAMWRAFHFCGIGANAHIVTSTYSYDSNGNLTSGAGWGYTWDYLNRMLSSGFGGSTTTYAYDATGNRVLQTSTTSTTFYPSKFYSFASMIVGSTTYATSTNYIWNGDTLLATIDQPMVNGTATGTAVTRYIHPDHLGSTNAVTDQNGALVQTLDYYPFGATRVSTSTYPTSEKRDFIGQFTDPQTSLDYLNARYYDSGRGQFLSEDPVFWGNQNLQDPQSLNVYSYSADNPITKKDPSGRQLEELVPIVEKASSEVEPIIQTSPSTWNQVSTAISAQSLQAIQEVDSYFNPVINDVTSLPNVAPTDLTGKIVYLGVGSVALLGAVEDFGQKVLDTIEAYGGIPTGSTAPTNSAYHRNPNQSYSGQHINTFSSHPTNNYSTPIQRTPSTVPSTINQSANSSNAGYSALPGLFNPFLPRSPSTPSKTN